MPIKLPSFKFRPAFKHLALALGLLVLIGQTVFVLFTVGRLRPVMSSVLREEGLDRMRRNLDLLNQDSRELREALKLPPLAYPEAGPREAENGQGQERASPALPFFRGIEKLIQIQNENAGVRELNQVLAAPWLGAFLKAEKLLVENRQPGQAWQRLLKNKRPYLRLGLEAATGRVQIESERGGRFPLKPGQEQAWLAELKAETQALDRHYEAYQAGQAGLHAAIRRGEVLAVCAERGLVFGPPQEGEGAYSVPLLLRRQRGAPRLVIELDRRSLKLSAGGSVFADARALAEGLPGLLRSLDARSDAELLAEKKKAELLEITADAGLKAYLASKQLVLAGAFREDSEYWYLDILNAAGGRVGSFGLQKSQGEYYLMDHEDVPLSSLKRLQQSGAALKKKTALPEAVPRLKGLYKKNAERVFLIVGAHEKMADSIMLAHVAEQRGKVTLISLPRDLYFREKKINSIYLRFGAERFVKEVSDLTGLAIDRYVIIDMYAFIDAIDIIGGLDLNFEEPVVDPSYRVRNGGVWSTLFYPQGRHHLSGLEALRVARSRNVVSDFGRAQRQQDIIKAVKERIEALGLGDLDKLFGLAQTLSAYVETDVSPMEAVSYMLRYVSAKVTKQVVLDVHNVLYATYENLIDNPDSDAAAEDENFDKGAYVLLPARDDWNLLRWFIRSVIEENV